MGTTITPFDPGPLVLANNGGPVETILPALSSAAVDAGNNLYESASDARDALRLVGGGIDIGAVEHQGGISGPLSLVVTTLDDELDYALPDASVASMGVGDLSLREALFLSELDPDTADTITFDASLFGGTLAQTMGQLEFGKSDVTITGLGRNNLTIDAQGASRVMFIGGDYANYGSVAISGLTLTGGATRAAVVAGRSTEVTRNSRCRTSPSPTTLRTPTEASIPTTMAFPYRTRA